MIRIAKYISFSESMSGMYSRSEGNGSSECITVIHPDDNNKIFTKGDLLSIALNKVKINFPDLPDDIYSWQDLGDFAEDGGFELADKVDAEMRLWVENNTQMYDEENVTSLYPLDEITKWERVANRFYEIV